MRATWGILALLSVAVLSGCATKDYVKQQNDPLNARICTLESKLGAMESRLAAAEGKATELSTALEETKKMAMDAKIATGRVDGVADMATAAANRSEAAAGKSEAAAGRAEAAAEKAIKAFTIGQKK